jgi:hypothetical protein
MAPNTQRVFHMSNVSHPVYLEILARRPDRWATFWMGSARLGCAIGDTTGTPAPAVPSRAIRA